ncbi:transmembrane protein [Actinidia rufa]|uniref:Transmembrane protein n=1 Tax=Actinidia rufa TaxID=165716 RepID=A0A7J0GAD0_9ERIC|nr:transmembrane protein [Actinidia rufa]
MTSKKVNLTIPRCSSPSNSTDMKDLYHCWSVIFVFANSHNLLFVLQTPFGYTRKDVLLIGLGVTIAGIGLESGLEFFGVDPLQAGNAVQLIFVLGLTIGWISTYIFRVANKDMTYAQQLRDYESKVMEKRLEGLTEAELEALLEQVEEEKRRLASGEQVN